MVEVEEFVARFLARSGEHARRSVIRRRYEFLPVAAYLDTLYVSPVDMERPQVLTWLHVPGGHYLVVAAGEKGVGILENQSTRRRTMGREILGNLAWGYVAEQYATGLGGHGHCLAVRAEVDALNDDTGLDSVFQLHVRIRIERHLAVVIVREDYGFPVGRHVHVSAILCHEFPLEVQSVICRR